MFISWKRLVLAVAVVVGFLAYLYLVADFGRSRLADAGTQVRQSQARRILIGDLQQLSERCRIRPPRLSAHRRRALSGTAAIRGGARQPDGRRARVELRRRRARTCSSPRAGCVMSQARRLANSMRPSRCIAHQGPDAALALTRTDSGEKVMEKFRNLARAMRDYEAVRIDRALGEWRTRTDVASAG